MTKSDSVVNETLTTTDQTCVDTGKPLASESTHWYRRDGSPCYQVQRAKGEGMRDTTLADARKLDLVPSVTNVLNVAAKPGLDAWKAKQLLESALTLPQLVGETLDDYALRVIEDSKAQSQKARDKGTELHAAIEQWIQNKVIDSQWIEHVIEINDTLLVRGMNIRQGKAEHSFASPLGYGGKIDWHNDESIICDFKTKERIDYKKQLVWPEHVQQLAAYGFGLFRPYSGEFLTESWITPELIQKGKFRAMNVFVGIEDTQVRVFEHEWLDLVDGFACFRLMLELWQRTKKFGPYAKIR